MEPERDVATPLPDPIEPEDLWIAPFFIVKIQPPPPEQEETQ